MIKSCPICGGEPVIRETFFGFIVECKGQFHHVVTWDDTEEQAIEKWNSRPVWYTCGVCGNRNYIGARCPVCGKDK